MTEIDWTGYPGVLSSETVPDCKHVEWVISKTEGREDPVKVLGETLLSFHYLSSNRRVFIRYNITNLYL